MAHSIGIVFYPPPDLAELDEGQFVLVHGQGLSQTPLRIEVLIQIGIADALVVHDVLA